MHSSSTDQEQEADSNKTVKNRTFMPLFSFLKL